MRAIHRVAVMVVAASLGHSAPALAQFKNGNQSALLDLPLLSQRSSVSQRVGLTDISIVYHRPLINGRVVWGGMVPYDRVWRAGANDNTTIAFSDPVMIEGKPLPAGRYGLHVLPTQTDWTFIFSKNSTSWGSFSYDEAEDVLRVTVKPITHSFVEALAFEFGTPGVDSAAVTLAWERMAASFSVAVDTRSITLARVRNQLRHLEGYKGQTWLDAAQYCVDNEFNYAEALTWVDRNIQLDGDKYESLDLKAQILDALNRQPEAAAVHAAALKLATPQQAYAYGDRLLRAKKLDEAKAVFLKTTADQPTVWLHWFGLGRVQLAQGDKSAARKSLDQALARAQRPNEKQAVQRVIDSLGGEA